MSGGGAAVLAQQAAQPGHHHHRLADRVRAHIFLCLLAYYVRWHLERRWASLLYRDEQPPILTDPVAAAERSASALEKARSGRRPDGDPVYSFRNLLGELATLTKNTVRLPDSGVTFEKLAQPHPSAKRGASTPRSLSLAVDRTRTTRPNLRKPAVSQELRIRRRSEFPHPTPQAGS